MIQSKKIYRYNDDFYLDYTGTNKIYGDFIATEISYNLDWSISWFDIFPRGGGASASNSYILDTRSSFTANFGIAIYSSFNSGSQSNQINIQFRASSGANLETFTTNGYLLNTLTNISHFIVIFESSTRQCKVYRNLELIGTFTNTIDFISTVPSFSLGASRSGSQSRIGGIRDFATYDKQLSEDEISYIYKTGVPPVSAYSNIQHYYPLNEIPTETGGNYFMSDKAESFNSSATNSEVELIGWTGTELGIPTNTTATSYRDFYTKANYIPDVGYKLGLNFDSSKQQYLEVTGLNSFSRVDGYTLVVGYESTDTTGNLFEASGTSQLFRLRKTTDLSFDFTTSLGTTATPFNTDDIDLVLCSDAITQDEYLGERKSFVSSNTIRTTLPIESIADFSLMNSFKIGDLLTCKIRYFTIIEGTLTKEQEKTIFNNSIYRSPYEVLQDTSKIILDVDFQNPFVDGTDIKFPDNSGNCEVIAKQNSGTDWSTLVGVQNSID